MSCPRTDSGPNNLNRKAKVNCASPPQKRRHNSKWCSDDRSHLELPVCIHLKPDSMPLLFCHFKQSHWWAGISFQKSRPPSSPLRKWRPRLVKWILICTGLELFNGTRRSGWQPTWQRWKSKLFTEQPVSICKLVLSCFTMKSQIAYFDWTQIKLHK